MLEKRQDEKIIINNKSEPKNSDGNGNCTWSWKVGVRTTPGNWKIVLKAEGVGQTETYFKVTE